MHEVGRYTDTVKENKETCETYTILMPASMCLSLCMPSHKNILYTYQLDTDVEFLLKKMLWQMCNVKNYRKKVKESD